MTTEVSPTVSPINLEVLERLAAKATPGPWCVESCGEKGDGSNMVGVAFVSGEEKPLSGFLRPFDDDGNEIEYYREELIAECEHHNRNSNADAAYIAALTPEVVAALVAAVKAALDHDRAVVAMQKLAIPHGSHWEARVDDAHAKFLVMRERLQPFKVSP